MYYSKCRSGLYAMPIIYIYIIFVYFVILIIVQTQLLINKVKKESVF